MDPERLAVALCGSPFLTQLPLSAGALRLSSLKGPDWAGRSQEFIVVLFSVTVLYFINFFPFVYIFCKDPTQLDDDSREVHLLSAWGLCIVVRIWTPELEHLGGSPIDFATS